MTISKKANLISRDGGKTFIKINDLSRTDAWFLSVCKDIRELPEAADFFEYVGPFVGYRCKFEDDYEMLNTIAERLGGKIVIGG